ncbi:uncharacterized protein LOC131878708 isoform X1 [Tigriopus californicus]|uniref:uncharacterized protein LOC131878708 isoform X1 n=1 Tax=Tigriopus californicus TaxID=6832 RepID=UPI0027D9DAD5|nr:uncharacterized protein LOC131878708 isoform X1 [Tigriopus californicus]
MAPGGGSKRKKKLVRTKRVSKTDTTSDGEQQHTSLSEEQGGENHHKQQEHFKQKQLHQDDQPEGDGHQQQQHHHHHQQQQQLDVSSHGSKDNDETLGDVSNAEAEVHHDAECGDDKSECSGSYYEDLGHLVPEDDLKLCAKQPHGTNANSYPRAKLLIRKDTVIQAVPRAREDDFSELERNQTSDIRSSDGFSSPRRTPPVCRQVLNLTPARPNGLTCPRDGSVSPKSVPANAPIPGQPVPIIVSSCLQALPWRKGLTTADQMGDQNQAHQLSNPKWRRAAVRAVQIQETKKGENNGSEAGPHHCNNIQSLRHPASKFQTGNGGVVNSDLPHDIPPPPPVPGTIPHVPPPPPPPEPWNQIGVLGLESYPPLCHGGQHNSVLVDMGKVVGVLRSHGPHVRQPAPEQSFEEVEEEGDDEEAVEHRDSHITNDHGSSNSMGDGTCTSCSGMTNSNDALDDSLCGDPLMYATFVAPVQQYSTDTEPSRQPSFNYPSRHSSFKQNSSENENTNHQNDSNYAPFPRLPQVHPPHPSHSHNYSDEVQDIYEKVPVEQWPLPPLPKRGSGGETHDDCVEISQEELDHQVAQERLSFISGSSNNEEEGDEDEDENQDEEEGGEPSFPALPPLPPTPKDLPSQSSPFTFAQEASLDQWGSGEDSETTFNTAGTVRRKNKRERNRTTVVEQQNEPCCRHNRSKSRSKSRSPGRTIDTAIVIVHHRRTAAPGTGSRGSSSRVGGSRGTSPDNISESSVSFHENELGSSKSEAASHPAGKQAYAKSAQVQNVSYPCPPVAFPRQGDPRHPNDGNGPFMAMFANRDSVRESWMSSGSEYQGSGASSASGKLPMQSVGTPRNVHNPPTSAVKPCDLYQQYNSAPMRHVMPLSSPMVPPIGCLPASSAECSVPTTPFHNTRSTAQIAARTSGGSLPRKRTPPTNLGNRSILRSSSRETGSSWSVHRSTSRLNRGGGSTMSLQARHSHSHSGTPEEERASRESSSTTSVSGILGTPPAPPAAPPAPCLSSYQSASLRVGYPDSVLMEEESESALVNNLQIRYRKDHIYTNIGSTLVSINPFKKIHLYTPDVIDVYRCHCLFELPPHIYAVTDRAWRQLRDINCDQCIVISGNSGAGKTEVAKLTLHYLAAVTSHEAECHSLKYQILQSNPVLEAFGNAKTKLNDNSSRFGKYTEISFDFKGDPMGGLVTTYLLEKSRVVGSSPSEGRNFHILYQTLLGADVPLLKELRLHRNLDSYRILHLNSGPRAITEPASGGNISVIDDRKDFLITKRAMEDVGMTPEEIVLVLRVVASILKLGNLHFVPTTNMDGTEGCGISNDYELYETCEVLQGDYGTIHSALVTRSIESRNEYLITDLSAKEAGFARDSLCRALYGRLFTWIVNRVNETIRVKTPRKHRTMGVLDLYGFESLEHNGFEQLVINFVNERLHQMILDLTLRAEQEEYREEGIEWRNVGFQDNSVICQLIAQSHSGLISLLDEVTLKRTANLAALDLSISTDGDSPTPKEVFMDRLQQSDLVRKFPIIQIPDEDSNVDFTINHFAGTVAYSAEDFVSRNQDGLDRDLSHAMFTCDHPILKVLFPEGNPRRTTRRRPATAGTQFKISIGALVNNLGGKSPHFVRCIKPNERKQPRNFDDELVKEQVRNHGLLATVQLRKQGFAFRLEYSQFLARYKMLSQHTWPHWRGPSVEGVTYLLRELPISANEYAFGRTKIFIRTHKTAELLEEYRREKIDDLATMIQKTYRGYIHRKKWDRLKNSQVIISTYWKRWKDHANIVELKQRRKEEWAALVLQHFLRSILRQKFLLRLSQCLPSESPLSKDWPSGPRYTRETNILLRRLFHKWRCHRYRFRYDQVARNRMREKVTASIIFKDRKASYPRSVPQPFLGDYINLRRNPAYRETLKNNHLSKRDKHLVYADMVNKMNRSNGKFVPILFVISTSSMLIMDQRTMQIKYRIPAAEIFKLSLSPYFDDIVVFHVRASSPTRELKSQANIPGCLSSENIKRKGDFVLQTGHVIEIVTKMFLVVQNATGKPPNVNVATEIEANFGNDPVPFTFKRTSGGTSQPNPGHVKLVKRGNKFEIVV